MTGTSSLRVPTEAPRGHEAPIRPTEGSNYKKPAAWPTPSKVIIIVIIVMIVMIVIIVIIVMMVMIVIIVIMILIMIVMIITPKKCTEGGGVTCCTGLVMDIFVICLIPNQYQIMYTRGRPRPPL